MKKIFHVLLPYLNAKYYPGQGIRWMIRGRNGRTAYCAFCGNFANVVGVVHLNKNQFNIPICKTHVHSYMNAHFEKWDLTAPCAIGMNLKFPKPYGPVIINQVA